MGAVLTVIALALTASATQITMDNIGGITFANCDGFESGHYENFALRYIGSSGDWIRPTVGVTGVAPIDGDYSLRWTAGPEEQEWVLVSDAFYIRKPFTVSAKIRVNAPIGESYGVGLGVLETYGTITGLRVGNDGACLNLDAASWTEGVEKEVNIVLGEVYRLEISFQKDNEIKAKIVDIKGQETVAEFSGESNLEPKAIGLYIHTRKDGVGWFYFDDVEVDSAAYRIRENTWVRSPKFVILPREPDVGEDQGNWVGAESVMKEDNEYLMWYRIRDNQERGAGYGFARSEDGLHWDKYENNPIFTHSTEFSSCEGISVLKVDNQYNAWYTVDANPWAVAYATSEDGINWTKHGIVIEGYCKDPVVVYVDGTYYLYAISPTNHDISVYTSQDGEKWQYMNTMRLMNHRHPGACYVEETGKFMLYLSAHEGTNNDGIHPLACVSVASSDDGIHFSGWSDILYDSLVGIGDRPNGGIDYVDFPTDGMNHLKNDKSLLMYYQARHDYNNNRPGWLYALDGKVVLMGRFSGLFVNVPTTIDPDDEYVYESFPINCDQAEGLDVRTDALVKIEVNAWNPSHARVADGTLITWENAEVQFLVSNLRPNSRYSLNLNDKDVDEQTTGGDERATFEATIPSDAEIEFSIELMEYPPWFVDDDGEVGLSDLMLVAGHFGETGAPGWIPSDVDGSGDVSLSDLMTVAGHWGETR